MDHQLCHCTIPKEAVLPCYPHGYLLFLQFVVEAQLVYRISTICYHQVWTSFRWNSMICYPKLEGLRECNLEVLCCSRARMYRIVATGRWSRRSLISAIAPSIDEGVVYFLGPFLLLLSLARRHFLLHLRCPRHLYYCHHDVWSKAQRIPFSFSFVSANCDWKCPVRVQSLGHRLTISSGQQTPSPSITPSNGIVS